MNGLITGGNKKALIMRALVVPAGLEPATR